MISFGPEKGSSEHQEQIDRITNDLKTFCNGKYNYEQVRRILLIYILDTDYSRSAIAEADSIYRKECKKKER